MPSRRTEGGAAAIEIFGEVLLHALHNLGDPDADHDRADESDQYLPKWDAHEFRRDRLLTLTRARCCPRGNPHCQHPEGEIDDGPTG